MAQRTQGDVEMVRTHPDPGTAAQLIFIRSVDRERYSVSSSAMADLYCATVGSEQEANAAFIVKAWNSHDKLVAALKLARTNLDYTLEGQQFRDVSAEIDAALAAAGAV